MRNRRNVAGSEGRGQTGGSPYGGNRDPRVSDVMSAPVETVAPDMRVAVASAWLTERDAAHLVVVGDGRLLGVACSFDLSSACSEALVGEFVRDALVVFPDTRLVDAAEHLRSSLCCLAVDSGSGEWRILTHADLGPTGVNFPECTACGELHRVRMIEAALAPFCDECIDTMSPSDFHDLYTDLGVLD